MHSWCDVCDFCFVCLFCWRSASLIASPPKPTLPIPFSSVCFVKLEYVVVCVSSWAYLEVVFAIVLLGMF